MLLGVLEMEETQTLLDNKRTCKRARGPCLILFFVHFTFNAWMPQVVRFNFTFNTLLDRHNEGPGALDVLSVIVVAWS